MISLDCSGCPARPGACGGCVVDLWCGGDDHLTGLIDEPCGYVLTLETRAAIEVLRGVGLLSKVEVLGVEHAA